MMPKESIDLDALRQLDAQLDALLDTYPELRTPDPEREAALTNWLQTHLQEGEDDATPQER